MRYSKGLSEKIQTISKLIALAFLIIILRVWHLETVQREEKRAQADQPKRRVIVEKASRGMITDRFGIPLAINKICYNAVLYYNQLLELPALSWKEDPTGKKMRIYPRREYIQNLSLQLAKLLHLDPVRIEDLIHSKASLFPHVPFLLKSGLSEEEHYQLASMEKDWPGIHAEIGSVRFYPKGKVGSSVIGMMGSISSKEYQAIADEIASLQNLLESGVDLKLASAARLQELKEQAYTLQDLIGKTGIEGKFEKELRGFYGKQIYEVDQKGKRLQELSGGRKAIPGKQILSSLSIELQEFAESLLAEHESLRDRKSIGIDPETKERKVLKQPWIKGGSIVALDPNTGEVLALASTPRFDPNDFIGSSNDETLEKKQSNVARWLENERWISWIWDGMQDLIRERFSPEKGFYEEARPLTWDFFLELLLPPGQLRAFFHRIDDVKTAIQIQEDYEASQFFTKEGTTHSEEQKRLEELFRPIHSEKDRLFIVDLCRLAVHAPAFSNEALKLIGSMKLSEYRALNQSVCRLEAKLKQEALLSFRKNEFQKWRETDQKPFLAQMRKEEKAAKRPPRPYIDYLDKKEKELFQQFWSQQRLETLAKAMREEKWFKNLNPSQIQEILHTFRQFSDLDRPLLGTYQRVRKKEEEQLEKHLAASFYPIGGFGFIRSYAFQATAPPGSVFKLVTSIAALSQTGGENPLTIIDEPKMGKKMIVASSLAGVPFPRSYKGGRLPKSNRSQIGKIDLPGALEQTSNPYFSILAGDILSDPEDLNATAHLFGFGARTGIDLPGEGKGNLPKDLRTNRTGLYSTAIGQHTLLVTPLQTAVMLSAIANEGKIFKPTLVKETVGRIPDRSYWTACEHTRPYEKELQAIGIFYPLFTALRGHHETSCIDTRTPEVSHTAFLPPSIRCQLLEGMDRVVWTNKGTARPNTIRNPHLLAQFLSLNHQMVGKTGTAEILFNANINPSSQPSMYKHIWFGSISFKQGLWEHPELVVVVYLRYGDRGGEAAPLAAQMIHKWREIQNRAKASK